MLNTSESLPGLTIGKAINNLDVYLGAAIPVLPNIGNNAAFTADYLSQPASGK